ncbi:MAG: hypothetical protein ACK5LG_22015 [Bacteroides thetaiotaomicron]
MKATLVTMGVAAILVLAISAAIIAAAPYVAMGIVVAGIYAWYCEDDPSDKDKPP